MTQKSPPAKEVLPEKPAESSNVEPEKEAPEDEKEEKGLGSLSIFLYSLDLCFQFQMLETVPI